MNFKKKVKSGIFEWNFSFKKWILATLISSSLVMLEGGFPPTTKLCSTAATAAFGLHLVDCAACMSFERVPDGSMYLWIHWPPSHSSSRSKFCLYGSHSVLECRECVCGTSAACKGHGILKWGFQGLSTLSHCLPVPQNCTTLLGLGLLGLFMAGKNRIDFVPMYLKTND